MSLLMEALKKAEEAKRRAGEGGELPELTLEPLTAQNAATSPLPDLAQHFATVDADLASIPTDAPPRRRPGAPTPPESNAQAAREGAERATVRNAFAAKETPPARPRLGLLLGAGTLALLAIGGYFWWQLQSMSPPQPLAARPVPAPAAPQALPAKAAPLPTPMPAPALNAPTPQAAATSPSQGNISAPPTETPPLFQATAKAPSSAPKVARPTS